MNFEFATAGRILFGPGRISAVGNLAAELGGRVLLVCGGTVERAAVLEAILHEAGLETLFFPVRSEPTIELIQQGLQAAIEGECEVIVGFGGGSAIDAGKAIAALVPNGSDPLDYLEVIGRGDPLLNPSLPYIAIPTTAGTGSEVTRNAVLASKEHRVKVSLRSAGMLPRIALVDPELTYSMPPDVTASTGLDALTQLIEPFLSSKHNPMTDALCREGLRHAAGNLLRAYRDGDDAEARTGMALASLMSGLALANSGLGAIHGFAGAFGGMFHAPHGATCAALLPHVMRVNLDHIIRTGTASGLLERFDDIGRLLTGDPAAGAHEAVDYSAHLVQEMGIPGLASYGLSASEIPTLISKASASSSMQGNPVPLSAEEMRHILTLAM